MHYARHAQVSGSDDTSPDCAMTSYIVCPDPSCLACQLVKVLDLLLLKSCKSGLCRYVAHNAVVAFSLVSWRLKFVLLVHCNCGPASPNSVLQTSLAGPIAFAFAQKSLSKLDSDVHQ